MKIQLPEKLRKYGKRGLIIYASWFVVKWAVVLTFGKELYAYFFPV